MLLKGKTAVVTGASRGIGKEIARVLAAEGAYVIGTATTENGASQLNEFFRSHALAGEGKVLNLSDEASIEQFASEISTGEPITILVNNAGITDDQLFLRMKKNAWDQVVTTNLSGPAYLTQLFLKGMIKARFGRIVNMSSVVGVMGNAGQANYAAAKAGLIGFTKSLAREVASRNVTVNAIAPGFIETDMTTQLTDAQKEAIHSQIPCGFMGSPEDIAMAVLFLCNPKTRYITGETLNINGGMYMV